MIKIRNAYLSGILTVAVFFGFIFPLHAYEDTELVEPNGGIQGDIELTAEVEGELAGYAEQENGDIIIGIIAVPPEVPVTIEKPRELFDKTVLAFPVALVALLLALVALVLLLVTGKKPPKTANVGINTDDASAQPNRLLQGELEGVKKNMRELEGDIRTLKGKVNELEATIYEQKSKIDRLEDKYSREINELKSLTSSEVAVREATRSGSSNPVDLFNIWARNPQSRLPSGFSYIREEPEMRRTQVLTDTSLETRWIVNKTGEKKYLFPNPNSFDPMTDISKFYAMSLEGLKPKGQNRVEITKACEMTDSGHINFTGELSLL